MVSLLQISSFSLFSFDRFEQGFEIADTKTLVIVALDDFEEKSRSILLWFGEQLQQVSLIIEINQDIQLLDSIQ